MSDAFSVNEMTVSERNLVEALSAAEHVLYGVLGAVGGRQRPSPMSLSLSLFEMALRKEDPTRPRSCGPVLAPILV